MARRKIAILGGGVGALTTAFELTRTPELAARHEVTVYQMGWRLGGKGASGRNRKPGKGMRIEEHGLHVWLGFYENAFAMMKAAYAERSVQPDEALLTWRDAFKPQSFTPIGQRVDGAWTYWGIHWPTNGDEPGDGKLLLSPWGAFTELLNLLEALVAEWRKVLKQVLADAVKVDAAGALVQFCAGLFAGLHDASELLAEEGLHKAAALVRALERDPRAHLPEDHADDHAAIEGLLRDFKVALGPHVDAMASEEPKLRWIWNVLELGVAIARGMLNPKYGILAHLDLERIDGYDFRTWLIENGASPALVNEGSEVRALYDLPFAYEDGQLDRPSFAAGTALRAVLRIVTTYKGAVLFLMQAGMGEAVVAPLYEVLRARGVKFEFFHKVKRLELSPDQNVVSRVHFGLQARTRDGKAYEPTFRVKNVTAWGSEPDWKQLENGARLEEDGVNFESHWCTQRDAAQVSIDVGRDFDDVVLGIALGAFKRLNAEPTMCEELFAASPRFERMASSLSLVPTQAVQLWTKPTLAGLGWSDLKPSADAVPEVLDVWADMSQELAREQWGTTGPGSIQYFCGIYPTDLNTRPSTDANVPARALAGVRETAIDWFSKYTGWMWPKATLPGTQALDYDVLFDTGGAAGEARLDAQWLRPNVDPTECYVASIRGTTSARLGAGESGFVNLVLAGDWTKNGINAGCVEAAVMSGMAASRVICGSPAHIVGEDFFRKPSGDSETAMGDLPAYVSGLRHGEQSIEPPGVIVGGDCSVFIIEQCDMAARQAFVDTMLNAPTGGSVRYSLLGSTALVFFMQAPKLTSPTEVVGYIADQECAFALPLIDLKTFKFGLWMPYVFINSSLGMVTGREVWGFQKEISSFSFPSPTDANPKFVANATLFTTLDQRTQGKLAPLVTIEKTGALGLRTTTVSTSAQAFDEIVKRVTAGAGKLLPHLAKDAIEVASLFGLGSIPAINFKQFRDAVDPTRACYQAIVESPLTLNQFTGFGLLGDGFTLSITPCESHAIAADLGLPTNGPIPVSHAFFVDVGFSAGAGRIVWQAP